MKKVLRIISIAILALWGVMSFSMHLEQGQDFVHMLQAQDYHEKVKLFASSPALVGNFSGNHVTWIILFGCLFVLMSKAFALKEKRLMITSAVLAIVFSFFQILGENIVFYLGLEVLFSYFWISMIKFIGLSFTYYSVIAVGFSKLSKWRKTEIKEEIGVFTTNRKSILVVTAILFVCWLPYLLKEFPGIATYDSIYQIQQALGIKKLTTWHPVLHTGLIQVCMKIGNDLFHSLNAGVAVYSVVQMILMASIFSISIWYMAKKEMPFGVRFVTLLYFAFCPTFPMMSITMGKDTIFSGMMVLLLIVLIELMTNANNVFQSKMKIALFALVTVITSLFRNNAMYMLILVTPFLVMYQKGYRLKIAGLLFGSVLLVLAINFIITHGLQVPHTNARGMAGEIELFSVPLQQIARVMVDYKETVSEEDKNEICSFFKSKNFYESYQPFLANPIKCFVNTTYFVEHKGEFIALWFRLMPRYLASYIDGFLCMTSGYFDPEENRISLWTGICPNDLEIETKPIYESYFVNLAEKFMNMQNVPIVGLLFSTGFVLWIILALLAFNLYQKRYELSFAFLPILVYLFTVCLGPLNTEYRYIFFEFTCLPILVGFTINNLEKRKEEKNG